MRGRHILEVITFLMTILMTTPCHAETCHDLVMSYIIADQDKPTEPGDYLYNEDGRSHKLMYTTGYCEGSYGSHGDKMREGLCASAPELYGSVAIIYEALPQEDGSYQIGEYLDTLEIRDTGYGFSTGYGKSSVRRDKKHLGTIEAGLHIDAYKNDLSACWAWMKRTKGMIFVEVVPGKG